MAEQHVDYDDTYLNQIYKQLADRRPGSSEESDLHDLRHLMFASRKKIADPKVPGSRRLNAALRKVVSDRFLQARELNGMSQTEAAERLGYKKSAQVSQWEHGKRQPPIDRMIITALVYGVSLDYLYGLTDEPERDQHFTYRKAMARNIESQLRNHADRIAESLMAMTKTGGMSLLTIKALVSRANEAATSMRRFAQINAKKFDNMPGGASVLHACVSLEALVREASAMVARVEGLTEQAIQSGERRANSSHPLFETPEYRQRQLDGLDG